MKIKIILSGLEYSSKHQDEVNELLDLPFRILKIENLLVQPSYSVGTSRRSICKQNYTPDLVTIITYEELR